MITIINYSDLRNWSTSLNKNQLVDITNYDLTIGQKLEKFAESYELKILEITASEFFNNTEKFPSELNLTEHRVTLGKIKSIADIEDNWSVKNVKEFVKKYGNDRKDYQDFVEDLNSIGQVIEISDHDLTFSVFLPNLTMESMHLTETLVWQLAYSYFKNLSVLEEPINSIIEYKEAFEFDNLGQFLTSQTVIVNNDNLKLLNGYVYRIYKDSKFFYELKNFLEDQKRDYSNMIQRLKNLESDKKIIL